MSSLTFYIIQAIFDVIVLGLICAAAKTDGKERIVKPWTQWALLGASIAHFAFILTAFLTGFEDLALMDVLNYPISGIMMFTIYIVLVLVFKKGIGGADTKVTSIMAFYLGLFPSVIMIIFHFLAAMVYVGYQWVKNKKRIASVPLMIYIGIGYIAALIFQWIAVILK